MGTSGRCRAATANDGRRTIDGERNTIESAPAQSAAGLAFGATSSSRLSPHLREVLFFRGDMLHRPGERIDQVYFLYSGIISLMAVMEGGATVETVSIGREGAIGTIEGFGSLNAFTCALCAGRRLGIANFRSTFRSILSDSPELKEIINHYHMTVMAHVQQTSSLQRTARSDFAAGADPAAVGRSLRRRYPAQPDALAEMLGVRRSSVTVAATTLRDLGAIDYRRAVIRILNRAKLEHVVCECYRTIRRSMDVGFRDPPTG